jgi:hypothetical protein
MSATRDAGSNPLNIIPWELCLERVEQSDVGTFAKFIGSLFL